VRAGLRAIVTRSPGVQGVNEVLTMHFGPRDVLAAISLDFEDALPAEAAERTVSGIEREIKTAFPEVRRIFIEVQSRAGQLQALRETAPLGES